MVQLLGVGGIFRRTFIVFLLALSLNTVGGAVPLVFEPETSGDRLYPIRSGLMLVPKSSQGLFSAYWRPEKGAWQIRFFASSKDVDELELSFLAIRRRIPLTPGGAHYIFQSPWNPAWGDGPVGFRTSKPGTVLLRKFTMLKVGEDAEIAPGLSQDLARGPKMPLAAYAVLWDQLGDDAAIDSEALKNPALRQLALHRGLAFERKSDEPKAAPQRRWSRDGIEYALWEDERGTLISMVNLQVKKAKPVLDEPFQSAAPQELLPLQALSLRP